MQAKVVGCWRYGYWTKLTLFYEPLPKGGIPPEQHPAIIEDSLEFDLDTGLVKHKFRHGKMAQVVERYLRENGPSLVKDICAYVGSKPNCVIPMMRRNPQLFKIIDYVTIPDVGWGKSRAILWGLVEVQN